MKHLRYFLFSAVAIFAVNFTPYAMAANPNLSACAYLSNKTLHGSFHAFTIKSVSGTFVMRFGPGYLNPITHAYSYYVSVAMPYFSWPNTMYATCSIVYGKKGEPLNVELYARPRNNYTPYLKMYSNSMAPGQSNYTFVGNSSQGKALINGYTYWLDSTI